MGNEYAGNPDADPRLQLIARARQLAEAPAEAELNSQTRPGSDGLQTRCPHCQNQVEVENNTPWTQITCDSCNNTFSLVDRDDRETIPGCGQLGQFEIVSRLGSGGFGTVWKAKDQRLDRLVALKVPHDRRMSLQEVTNFLREARAAAQLQHPNIVAIHEVGRSGDTIFIVYDLVDGVSLSDWLVARSMTFRETALFCSRVAEALDYAHRHGVIHRDLKPSNILVVPVESHSNDPFDFRHKEPSKEPFARQREIGDSASLFPYLTDFGLAKRQSADVTVTIDGQVVGTPAYMSPEQARGGSSNVENRADIYSLGVILFELLTGDLPFRGTVPVILEQVVRDDPPSPRRLNAAIPRDLETICLKCLSRDPSRRYQDARQVTEELTRFLNHQPIIARPLGLHHRLWRWSRRKPLAATLMFVLSLVAVIAPWIAIHEASLAKRESMARAAAVVSDLNARQTAYAFGMNSVQQSIDQNNITRASSILRSYLPGSKQVDLRSFPWYYWWGVVHEGLVRRWQCAQRPIEVACDTEGNLVAFCGARGKITVWDLQSDCLHATLDFGGQAAQALAISADGKLLAAAGDPGVAIPNIVVYRTDSTTPVFNLPGHSLSIRDLAFSPDGKQLASASYDGTVKLWDLESGECQETLTGHSGAVYSVCYLPDQSRLVTGGGSDPPSATNIANEVIVWNLGDHSIVARKTMFAASVNGISIIGDGRAIVAAGTDKMPVVLDPDDLSPILELQPATGIIYAVASSEHVVLGSGSQGLIWVWDAMTGRLIDTLPGHSDLVFTIAAPGSLEHVFSASADRSISMWRVHDHVAMDAGNTDADTAISELTGDELGAGRFLAKFEGQLVPERTQMFWVENKLHIQTSSALDVWDPRLSQASESDFAFPKQFFPIKGSGSWVLAMSDETSLDEGLALLQPGTDERIPLSIEFNVDVSRVAMAADQRLVAIGTGRSTNSMDKPVPVFVCDCRSGQVVHRLEGHHRVISGLAFSADGRMLAIASGDRIVSVWNVETGTCIRRFEELFEKTLLFFSDIEFSPDTQSLLAFNRLGEICFWDTDTWQYEFQVRRGLSASAIDYSPDGRIAAVAMNRKVSATDEAPVAEIELWDLKTRELTSVLRARHGSLVSIKFSADQSQLIGLTVDGGLWQWTAATPAEVDSLLFNEIQVEE